MLLDRGEVQNYDYDRMVLEFTMLNEGKIIRCVISSAAMDRLDGGRDVKADHRLDQFMRLRDRIEERVQSGSLKMYNPIGLWCCDPTTSDG